MIDRTPRHGHVLKTRRQCSETVSFSGALSAVSWRINLLSIYFGMLTFSQSNYEDKNKESVWINKV